MKRARTRTARAQRFRGLVDVSRRALHDVAVPKIRGASLAEHRTTTRAALFTALAALMREVGFDAVTLVEVAQRAGVGRTAIYNYFPDKESMLLEFIAEETGRYLGHVRTGLEEIDDPIEQLRTYARELLLLESYYHVNLGPALRDVVSAQARDRLREHIEAVEDVLRTVLGRGVAQGRIPPQELDITVPLVHSALTGRRLPDRDPDREAAIEAIERFVLGGVGVDEAHPA